MAGEITQELKSLLARKNGESKDRDGKYVFPMLNYKLANFVHLAQDE